MPESMLINLDEFRWQRPASRKKGFQWKGTGSEMCLASIPGVVFKPYQPHPGIFRDFARLERTPRAVLEFANRYGKLQERLEFNSFDFWSQGIQHMNQLVALCDTVIEANRKRIHEALEPFLSAPYLANDDVIRPILQKKKRGEVISPNEEVNAAVICLIRAIAPQGRFNVEASWFQGKVVLRFMHNDLLGYMFHQLGLALIGRRRFQQCEGCGRWSLISGVSRSNRTTCMDYCRVRLYRRRKRAKELHRQGWSPQKIARVMQEDLSKVKEWLPKK
jgi:hypothetical protein